MTVSLSDEAYEGMVDALLSVPEPEEPATHPFELYYRPTAKGPLRFLEHIANAQAGCANAGCGASRYHPIHLA